MRLNKYLALCGLGSRRAVEQLILDGQVTLNGKPVGDLATQVDEARDAVAVQDHPVHPVARRNFEYILLNKPRGYDVTRGGRHHHRRAWDLLPKDTHPSVQSVGRLDRNSTGLLLFTNDGDLAFRLTHPRFGCRKIYEVELEREMPEEGLNRLREGVELEDGPAKAVAVERLPAVEEGGYPRLRIVMEEGRNRIVRRLCEAVGYPVVSLNRSTFGPLTLGDVPRGKTRPLTPREVTRLRQAVGLTAGGAPGETQHEKHPRAAAPQGRRQPGKQGGQGKAPGRGRSRRTERGAEPPWPRPGRGPAKRRRD